MLWLQAIVKLRKLQQYEKTRDRTNGLCPRRIKKPAYMKASDTSNGSQNGL